MSYILRACIWQHFSSFQVLKPILQVDDALEFMKDEYNTRMENCDQREVTINISHFVFFSTMF